MTFNKDTQPIDVFSGEYRFLSNFYPARITIGDVSYPTLEHAYQALKTVDPKERHAILKQVTPAGAKRYGKKLVLRPKWDNVKIGVMFALLRLKFAEPQLRKKLLSTGDAELIEGNYRGDTFWGVCRDIGENHLGKLLMKVRAGIRKEQEAP